jgi:hypothetical protein
MRAAFALSALLTGCVLDLPDMPGLACDDQHPCESGRACVSGVCDTARVWRQAVDGFSSMDVLPGATLSLGDGNAVTSTVPGADDAHDRATAVATMPLPTSGDGHLNGTFRLAAPLDLSGTSTWLYLGAGSQEILSLAFDATGALVCGGQAAAGSGGFSPNVDYAVDVTWQHGSFQRVAVNGTLLLDGTRDSSVVVPDQLRLGIFRYDGDADAGWSITLSGWQLAADPGTPL